jgi:hypothetical protein
MYNVLPNYLERFSFEIKQPSEQFAGFSFPRGEHSVRLEGTLSPGCPALKA